MLDGSIVKKMHLIHKNKLNMLTCVYDNKEYIQYKRERNCQSMSSVPFTKRCPVAHDDISLCGGSSRI